MKDVVFITGNQKKADYLGELLGHSIDHVKIDLDEIQSLDLREVVKHKLHQAYAEVNRPVLVEDLSLEGMCRLLDGKARGATARCVFGYYDGKTETYFEGGMEGSIPEKPSGDKGYGWDPVFIPEGYSVTRADLSPEDDHMTYLKIKPIAQVREFLIGN